MKTTAGIAAISYRVLNSCDFSKFQDPHKLSLFKLMRALKPVAVSIEDAVRDATEKLRNEQIEQIAQKVMARSPLSETQRQAWGKYNADISNLIFSEENKEVEIDAEPISEEALDAVVSASRCSGADLMAFSETFAI